MRGHSPDSELPEGTLRITPRLFV